jgi:transcriptional regulator with XRE-family HTH domain
MGERMLKPNNRLRAAREEKIWTQEEAAAVIGVDTQTYWRWENGEQRPRSYALRKLREVFGKTTDELGFGDAPMQAIQNEDQQLPEERAFQANSSIITLNEEQVAALLAFFRLGEDNMVHFDPSRRAALLEALGIVGTVALAPLQATGWERLSGIAIQSSYLTPEGFEEFENLISICWKLLKGNDLAAVEYLLPKFFPKMLQLVQQPSEYQQALAGLVAHGYNIQGLLDGHKDNLSARLADSQKSEQYSQLAHNHDLEITALIAQAVTFDYNKQHRKSLQIYQQAEQLLSWPDASPLSKARVYAGLAGSHARCGQDELQAKTYLELAQTTMPGVPEHDPSFAYADVGRFTLLLWGGRMHLELNPEEAWNTFTQFEQLPDVPLRNRTEFLNHMVEASIATGDMERSITTLETAIKAANMLNSERRKRETRDIYTTMRMVWRHEPKVKRLSDLFHA